MSAPAEERRRFSRVAFHRSAELQAGAERSSCEVLDLSLRGALVELPAGPAASAGPCTLTLRLDPEATIRMAGEIVHREGRLVGLRCTEIDLDSIAHLRRLVELNLGDDELLHRELTALVGRR